MTGSSSWLSGFRAAHRRGVSAAAARSPIKSRKSATPAKPSNCPANGEANPKMKMKRAGAATLTIWRVSMPDAADAPGRFRNKPLAASSAHTSYCACAALTDARDRQPSSMTNAAPNSRCGLFKYTQNCESGDVQSDFGLKTETSLGVSSELFGNSKMVAAAVGYPSGIRVAASA